MLLEFFVDVLVLFFDHVNLTVKHIDVVEEGDVLLLCLYESRYNFVDRGNSSRLLDLLECVFDNFDVTGIHVHQILLLFVVVDNFIKTDFEQDGGVGEIRIIVASLLGAHVLGAGPVSLVGIRLLEPVGKFENTMLKVELVHLVLCLECEDLILGLYAEVVALHCKTATFLNFLDKSPDLHIFTFKTRLLTNKLN